MTRSAAERRLLALVKAGGLPRPETNVKVAGHEVDMLWPAAHVVVEVDGFAFHSGRGAFERDRRRDADLQAAGHRVLRITWRRLQAEPEAVLVALTTGADGSARRAVDEMRISRTGLRPDPPFRGRR